MAETGTLMHPGTPNLRKASSLTWGNDAWSSFGGGTLAAWWWDTSCIMMHPRTKVSKRETGAGLQKRVVFIASSRACDLMYTGVLGWALVPPSSNLVLPPETEEPYHGCNGTKPKQCLAKKQNGHEMSTYGGFWVRLELFYLSGKKKLENQR